MNGMIVIMSTWNWYV